MPPAAQVYYYVKNKPALTSVKILYKYKLEVFKDHNLLLNLKLHFVLKSSYY